MATDAKPAGWDKADGGARSVEDWQKQTTGNEPGIEPRLQWQEEAELHYAKEELAQLGANARGEREGQIEESRGRDGQRDTTQDRDRTNDRPRSYVDQQRQASQLARVNAKIKEVADRIRGAEPKREDPMKAKIQALAERFNDRGRGRADEGRGR